MADKVDVSCPFCDADYVVKHDLETPYSLDFCPFCGEDIGDDDELKFIEDGDDVDDW